MLPITGYTLCMEIKEITDEKILDEFKTREWPPVDKIHYGDSQLVDFDEHEKTYSAEINGNVAGYLKISTEMGVCKIVTIIVGMAYRKQGIGAAFVAHAEAEAKELGCHKVILETGIDWDAKKLYEKLGYKDVVILKNHYDKRDFVLMQKFI